MKRTGTGAALLSLMLLNAPAIAQSTSPKPMASLPKATQKTPPSPSSPGTTARAGNRNPVAGVLAATPYKWEESSFPAEKEGGIWPTRTYFNWSFNKDFTEVNAPERGSTPFTVMAIANNHRSPGNVVALGADTIIRSDNGVGFAANFIVRTDSGIKNPKMIGVEVDIEPAVGVVPNQDSIGVPINIFNSAFPGAAIQTGSIGGGTFANGLILYGIAKSGAGLAAGNGASMNALVNSSVCDCQNAAFVHGTGVTQGDAYGTKGIGGSPYVYGDVSNNLLLRLGSKGSIRIVSSDGNTELFSVTSGGDITVNGKHAVSCSGPPTSSFTVSSGIVTHC